VPVVLRTDSPARQRQQRCHHAGQGLRTHPKPPVKAAGRMWTAVRVGPVLTLLDGFTHPAVEKMNGVFARATGLNRASCSSISEEGALCTARRSKDVALADARPARSGGAASSAVNFCTVRSHSGKPRA